MAIKELAIVSTFEQTMLSELLTSISGVFDQDGRDAWNAYNEETQVGLLLDYANPDKILRSFKVHHKDMLQQATEFFKKPGQAQLKQLLPQYKGFSF